MLESVQDKGFLRYIIMFLQHDLRSRRQNRKESTSSAQDIKIYDPFYLFQCEEAVIAGNEHEKNCRYPSDNICPKYENCRQYSLHISLELMAALEYKSYQPWTLNLIS